MRASLDCEVYSDYFLAIIGGHVFELFPGSLPFPSGEVRKLLADQPTMSFNGPGFDLPLLALACSGYSCDKLKLACDKLIAGTAPWKVGAIPPNWLTDHVDLAAVAPGVMVSLKAYGARMGTRTIEDLPYAPDSSITPDMRAVLRKYCQLDNQLNAELYAEVAPAVQLRLDIAKELGLPTGSLLAKTDPQIAESIFKVKLGEPDRRAHSTKESLRYRVPEYIQFRTRELQAIRDMVDSAEYPMLAGGTAGMPKHFEPFHFHTCKYMLGVGGLHSISLSMHVENVTDIDVRSLYPSLILNHGWSPPGMTGFPSVYRQIYTDRFAAKAAGDKVKDAALKLALNGSYGKFGSVYSFLYAPQLLLNTCMTGQLSLLMLIEGIVLAGGTVHVANTDSVSFTGGDMSKPMAIWETITGLHLESETFEHLWSRDVNTYIATGPLKTKGAMAKPGLSATPRYHICRDAAIAYLEHGTPVQETIDACNDVRRFVAVRNVTGGFVGGGKVARWYVAHGGEPLVTKKKGDQVAGTGVGVRVALTLPDELPSDLNREFYYQEAIDILESLGCKHARNTN